MRLRDVDFSAVHRFIGNAQSERGEFLCHDCGKSIAMLRIIEDRHVFGQPPPEVDVGRSVQELAAMRWRRRYLGGWGRVSVLATNWVIAGMSCC